MKQIRQIRWSNPIFFFEETGGVRCPYWSNPKFKLAFGIDLVDFFKSVGEPSAGGVRKLNYFWGSQYV